MNRKVTSNLLDVGCGRGEFVLAARSAKIDAFGIDVNAYGIECYNSSVDCADRGACVAYDGSLFPFESARFKFMHCWFVFEHIPAPHEVLSEMSRVADENCVLVLNAQDGRTLYEAHAQIPWIPFLPASLRRVWLDELTTAERRDYIMSCVFPTTVDEIVAALKFCGWAIHSVHLSGPEQKVPIARPHNESTTRRAAHEASLLSSKGMWPTTPLNYTVRAIRRHY